MSTVGGPVTLFHNDSNTMRRWIGFELVGDGARSNRNAIGAELRVEAAGQTTLHFASGGGSYLSAHDRAFSVGVAEAGEVDLVTVRWPSGRVQSFPSLAVNAYWRLREGFERAERSAAKITFP